MLAYQRSTRSTLKTQNKPGAKVALDVVKKDLTVHVGQLFNIGVPNDLDAIKVNVPLSIDILGFSLNQPYPRTASAKSNHHDPKHKAIRFLSLRQLFQPFLRSFGYCKHGFSSYN